MTNSGITIHLAETGSRNAVGETAVDLIGVLEHSTALRYSHARRFFCWLDARYIHLRHNNNNLRSNRNIISPRVR